MNTLVRDIQLLLLDFEKASIILHHAEYEEAHWLCYSPSRFNDPIPVKLPPVVQQRIDAEKAFDEITAKLKQVYKDHPDEVLVAKLGL